MFGLGRQIDPRLGGLTAPAPPPIDTPGRAPGVLAFHGFGGTTREVELCTDVAQELGLCARARLLPGHGSHAQDLARTGFSDWTAGGEAMLHDFAAGGPVIACGLSMGALVAAHLALSSPERVRGLVLLANAAWLRPQLALPLRLLGALHVPNFMLAKGASDISDVAARGTQISYNADPVRAAIDLERGARTLRSQLKHVRCPTLIIHGAKDRVCPVSNAARVASLLGTTDVRVVILPLSHHILTRDVEHVAVARELRVFFKRIAAQTPVEP